MNRPYASDHVCEAPGCSNPSPTARCCGNACRARVWKMEHGYRERRRGVRNASQRAQARRERRYAILRRADSDTLVIVALVTAPSKRAAERAAGIAGQVDALAVAAKHLPSETI